MSTTIEVQIEGGKATAAPPLGPALGPMGVNIGDVVNSINEKTSSFKGMQVPVKVIVDEDTKEYNIKVGTPPASALIKQEAQLKSGASRVSTDFVADLAIEQIIKIAKMKEDDLAGDSMKERVKEIIGTCNSMGVKVKGDKGIDAIEKVNQGAYDKEIKAEKTEITAEEQKELEEERARMQQELEDKREEYEKQANKIKEENSDKPIEEIRKAMEEQEIPEEIMNKVAPMPTGEKKEE